MNFFGRLGIDFNLILAQVVNFAILVFILFKFVYKPIFKKIEDDEAKLKEAETKAAELDEEKRVFTEAKTKEEKETRQKSEQILAEAEEIAKTLRQKTLQKTQSEADEILTLAKNEYAFSKKTSGIKAGGLSEIFKDKKVYGELENIFFERLMTDVRENLVKYKGIGHVTLEFAHELSSAKLSKLKTFIKRYIGAATKVETQENKNLIAGYRLLTNKMAVDQNLFYEMQNG